MTRTPLRRLAAIAAAWTLAATDTPPPRWAAAALAPQTAIGGRPQPADVTIRERLRFAAAGASVRVLVSNAIGSAPVVIDAAHLALTDADGAVRAETDRRLTFGGAAGVTLAPGEARHSDPVALTVAAMDGGAVSFHYPVAARPSGHYGWGQRVGGNHVGDPVLPAAPSPQVLIAAQVEVAPSRTTPVLVAIGDSITAGAGSTPRAFRSWPDLLAQRAAPRGWSVVNAGIGGNRVLHDGNGPALERRFDRDALDVPGVRAVILLEGVNDLGRSDAPRADPADRQDVSADAIIAAYRRLIARAHARGVRIYGGTILPYKGAGYWAARGEAKRVAINRWIRRSGAFDGVIDFDAATRDPGDPQALRAAAGSRDALHPGDGGYALMAAAVPGRVFRLRR